MVRREPQKSKDNPYRDYYIWRPARATARRPTTGASFFSGSAWEWDEPTGAILPALFAEKQPDLNWENPAVRAEMYDMMRFWLDKGVTGSAWT